VNVDGAAHSTMVSRESPNSENGQPSEYKREHDLTYHPAREQIEPRAAEEAASVQVRRIHQELAEAHSAMAAQPGWPRGH
jgi:hypothetical protein